MIWRLKFWAKHQWKAKLYTLPIWAIAFLLLLSIWKSLGAWLPVWLQIVGSAIVASLGIWGSKLTANIWSRKELARRYPGEYACPQCGTFLQVEMRSEAAGDTNVGGGRIIRQFGSVSYQACKKCGYERRMNA